MIKIKMQTVMQFSYGIITFECFVLLYVWNTVLNKMHRFQKILESHTIQNIQALQEYFLQDSDATSLKSPEEAEELFNTCDA